MQIRLALVLVTLGAIVGALGVNLIPSATASDGDSAAYTQCATLPVTPLKRTYTAPGQAGPLEGITIPPGWTVEDALTLKERNWLVICQ
ncbi:MAG: hypothetical protein ACI9MC_002460 [Kiritimatiellia bacterium]|jgi:hypothetical protein